MKVWVDCTAAAHPLVLRPIIERLEARGDEVFVTAREYGQTLGRARAARHPLHGGRQPRRRLALRKGGRSPGARRAAGAAGLAAPARPGDRPRLGRPRRRLLRCSGSPRCRCRTTSSPTCSARSRSGAARRVLVPDSIPVERLAQDRREGDEAGPLPRPEGGVLPRRLRARPGRARRARASTARRCSSSCGRRRRPPSTTPATTSTARRARPPRRGEAEAQAVVIPRTDGAGRGGAGARRGQPDRPGRGDRRPEPDRLRRPGGQRRRHDEPRGGRARHARLHHLHRAAWAGSTRR